MRAFAIVCLFAAACGDDAPPAADGGISTDKCDYVPMTATAHAGGTVTAAQLQAGAADNMLDVPVGTALGGYTARAGFLGAAGVVDTRKIAISSTFNPSIGVTSAPRVKGLALTAGDETVVILKVDMIYVFEGMVFDLEQRLGPDFAGKVIITSSHSHSAWAQQYFGGPLQLGGGVFRELVYTRFLDAFEKTAREALAARRDAKIGFFFDGNFDPTNVVNHDRRGENDMLPGGNVKDNHFYMIRVDGTDGQPIAALPVFGEHGVLNGEDNPFASTDAPGALERVMQEQFSSKVVVMHLQSAGGDNSPSGHGGVDCNVKPGKAGDPCFNWVSEEGHGRAAAPILMDAWTAAGANMQTSVELEMVSRSIEVGPKPETFSIRDGALTYAPFDTTKPPDGIVYEDDNTTLKNPIDEFNAPVGAALCESETAMFPAAEIEGDEGILPYGSCLRLDAAAEILGPIFKTDFGVDDHSPVCEETRTTISALRINDYVFGTMPGELTVMLATYLRTKAPVAADHTILLGYAQGHIGYLLRPEDWMKGGYEPSITFWGPLAAEHVGEKLVDLMGLVMTPQREDGTTDGTNRVTIPMIEDGLMIDNPAPEAGTVPATVPAETWARTGTPTQAQPAAQVARVSGVAQFVFYGDDPSVHTPHITLQYEATPGVFSDVVRKSGRAVEDQELVLAYTPSPLQRSGPQHHVWVVEWQAVPWVGSPDGDSLDARGNVRLGNYRFHVEGSGWSLDSSPFAVVTGGLAITAARATTINVGVHWHAPKGWRLMDMNLMSNQPIPVRMQSVKVELLNAASSVLATTLPTTDANGSVSVADATGATQARVTDAFGNVQTVAIP